MTWDALTIAGADTFGPSMMATPIGPVAVWTNARPDSEGRTNQDALAVIPVGPGNVVAAVIDGMGGAAGGDRAADLTARALARAFRSPPADAVGVRATILEAVDQANAAVLDLGIGAGATLAIADIHQRDLRTLHVGDAGVWVVGQRGKERWWTPSHSPVGYAIQAGILDESAAMLHEDRHLVSNSLGSPEMHVEVGPRIKVSFRDTVLVASDGVFDNLTLPEIGSLIRTGSLESAARRLADSLRRRMAGSDRSAPSKPDDATFILCRPSLGA